MAKRLDVKEVRQFILSNVSNHPSDIALLTADHFGVSRQSAHSHLKRLVDGAELKATGHARHRKYEIVRNVQSKQLDLATNRDEDLVWRDFVGPRVEDLKSNVSIICHHGFTEMFNNAIDHSEGTEACVTIARSPIDVIIMIQDNGVGIFEKIRSRFDLSDHRQAILELSKGKLTTDPTRHSGEGIYFTSRMFDNFHILSGNLIFSHTIEHDDWLTESRENFIEGTVVSMTVAVNSDRTSQQVYDRHIRETEKEEFAFSRTHVPLRLATYGNDGLVSRSQARRVLTRFDRFKEVLLDFAGIETVGQAFTDEIFRVFRNANPDIKIIHVNANENINRMIRHVTQSGYQRTDGVAPRS